MRILARAAFMHHGDFLGVYQHHRVVMMHECSSILQHWRVTSQDYIYTSFFSKSIYHRSSYVELVDGPSERFNGLHVQMVSRLVKNEEVGAEIIHRSQL